MEKQGVVTEKTLCQCGSGLPVHKSKSASSDAEIFMCKECETKNKTVHETVSFQKN